MSQTGLRLGSDWARLLSFRRGSHAASKQIRLPGGVRINHDGYQVRYLGPDGERHSKTFTHLEDAKYWHAVDCGPQQSVRGRRSAEALVEESLR